MTGADLSWINSIDDKREAKQACNKEIANTTMAIYALLY